MENEVVSGGGGPYDSETEMSTRTAVVILRVLALAVMVLAVYALNRWSVPFGDDIAYSLEGENTPLEGSVHHAESFVDILHMQVTDYVKGPNGRILVHTVVAAFCALGFHGLFDVINTGVWFLLVWLVLREGRARGNFVFGAALMFAFLWQAETCSSSIAFAINYLWMACLTIVMMDLWREHDAWWMTPVSFLFGWSQEAFVLPMVASLGACCVVRSFKRKRWDWSLRRNLAFVAMVAGALGCIGGHFLSGRAVVHESCSRLAILAMPVWPIMLVGCVFALVWRNRRHIWSLVGADLEWWFYFLAALAMFGLIGVQGLRLAMPMLLSALILCVRNRRFFVRLRGFCPFLVAFALVWLVAGAIIQYRLARAHAEMVDTYLKDSQGWTFRRAVATGPWDGTVCSMQPSPWTLGLLRQFHGHAKRPVVLSPSLYEEVMRSSATNRIYRIPPFSRTGIRRFLPGRFRRMFPDEDYHVCLPAAKVTITDPCGHEVTVLGEEVR